MRRGAVPAESADTLTHDDDIVRLIALTTTTRMPCWAPIRTPEVWSSTALRPGVASVHVRTEDTEVRLEAVVPETLFEGVLEGATLPLEYRLVVEYVDGGTETIADPYSFLPTVGDVDLHLLGEGRHERLGCVLGAHARQSQGVTGTGFAVWAPTARPVALVGDFNLWNPLTHPMRSLGSSGVWELFVPGIGPGVHYKFAVRGADGAMRLKADPVAARTEAPPQTASIVFHPGHEWSDHDWMQRRRGSQPWREPVSIYEVHLGSWRPGLGYRELADACSRTT